MAANTDPIFSSAPDVQFGSIASGASANTALDGTGTVTTVFTADATNGGFLQRLRVKAPSVSTPTVMRIFINNGSTNATASNNSLFEEILIPTITATNVASTISMEVPMSIALPAGYKVNVCLGTSITGAVYVTAVGGKF